MESILVSEGQCGGRSQNSGIEEFTDDIRSNVLQRTGVMKLADNRYGLEVRRS